MNASRHCRGRPEGLSGRALGSPRSPSESRPSASSGATAGGAHGFVENPHARSWQDWGKPRRLCVRRSPRLVSFPLLARRPPLPAMVTGLLAAAAGTAGTVPGATSLPDGAAAAAGLGAAGLGLAHGRRLICWRALLVPGGAGVQLRLQPVRRGVRAGAGAAAAERRCRERRRGCRLPGLGRLLFFALALPACISALIQLNHTRRRPALEDCDCAQDELQVYQARREAVPAPDERRRRRRPQRAGAGGVWAAPRPEAL